MSADNIVELQPRAAQRAKNAEERFGRAVNLMTMLAQQALLDDNPEQRDEFLNVAHHFRSKRFQDARHALPQVEKQPDACWNDGPKGGAL